MNICFGNTKRLKVHGGGTWQNLRAVSAGSLNVKVEARVKANHASTPSTNRMMSVLTRFSSAGSLAPRANAKKRVNAAAEKVNADVATPLAATARS